MKSSEIIDLLQQAIPEATFSCSGDGCHFTISAVGQCFEGLSSLKRQQLLNNVLAPHIDSGAIHAVNYKISVSQSQH